MILDAGSGIRAIGASIDDLEQVDILLTHLHMDHVQGLPFFAPLLDPDVRVDIWGPISTTNNLRDRLARYLSPPLFPIWVRDLPNVWFHDVTPGRFEVGSLEVAADLVCHPGSTLGYRIEEGESVLTYLPDHEPALGSDLSQKERMWTSGYALAHEANVLIHDSQYTDEEYATRVGWGHSTFGQTAAFADLAEVENLVTFHHDPSHGDEALELAHSELTAAASNYEVIPGRAGLQITI